MAQQESVAPAVPLSTCPTVIRQEFCCYAASLEWKSPVSASVAMEQLCTMRQECAQRDILFPFTNVTAILNKNPQKFNRLLQQAMHKPPAQANEAESNVLLHPAAATA